MVTVHNDRSPEFSVPPEVAREMRATGFESFPMTTASPCTRACASVTPGTDAAIATASKVTLSRISNPNAVSIVLAACTYASTFSYDSANSALNVPSSVSRNMKVPERKAVLTMIASAVSRMRPNRAVTFLRARRSMVKSGSL